MATDVCKKEDNKAAGDPLPILTIAAPSGFP
jgi:hypothetical protein